MNHCLTSIFPFLFSDIYIMYIQTIFLQIPRGRDKMNNFIFFSSISINYHSSSICLKYSFKYMYSIMHIMISTRSPSSYSIAVLSKTVFKVECVM